MARSSPAEPLVPALQDSRPVRGRLRVFVPGSASEGGESVRGRWAFVNGPSYSGMEDNDIRGFLDGRFYNGWNQPGQVHVRVGRVGRWPGSSAPTGRSPVYGEYELIRLLQRWTDVTLPPAARVTGASLHLTVEKGCTDPLRLLLYAVRRDWNPGRGGVHGNDASAPRPGDVWWNFAEHEEQRWALPGAGFASSTDERADTDAMPLAEAGYAPGDENLVFESERLSRYVDERLETKRPVLLLLKTSDHLEDIPGAQLALHSANYGSSRNPARRPRLEVGWECSAEPMLLDREVVLEEGRAMTLPAVQTDPSQPVCVDFDPVEDGPAPTILFRAGDSDPSDGWQEVGRAIPPGSRPDQFRVVAARDPVGLGSEFRDRLRHTWITSGLPEDGRVEWIFTSPSGLAHRRGGVYAGDYTWSVAFTPWEPGHWVYRWEHDLTGEVSAGPRGRFTVLARDADAVREALDRLGEEIEASGLDRHSDGRDPYRVRFSRLVREAARVESAGGLPRASLEDLLPKLDEVRSVLWGRELPRPIPLRSMPIREEVNGRGLPDPIPDLHDGRRGWIESALRRLGHRFARLRRRLPGDEA